MPAMPDTTPKKTAFFDFDGTIAAPVFDVGEKKTPGFPFGEWKTYVSENPDAYCDTVPVIPVLSYAIRLHACGWDLKILTGTNSDNSEHTKRKWLEDTEFAWLFSEIVPVKKQSDKVGYVLEYARNNGLAPADCLVVDDNYVTVIAATAAGISAMHVSHVIAGNYDPSGTNPRLDGRDA